MTSEKYPKAKTGRGFTSIICIVLCSWLIATGITLVLIDQDTYCKAYLVVTVRSMLQNALQNPTSVTFHNLRLGLGKATVVNMHITTPDDGWSWHTDILELHFSLWHMIQHRSLEIQAMLKQSRVTSAITESGIAIAPAIKRLFSVSNTGKFITVTHVTILNNDITLAHTLGNICAQVTANLPLIGRYRTSSIWWHEGNAHYQHYPVIAHSHGLYRYDHDQKNTTIKHETTLFPTYLPDCVMQGTMTHDKGTWNLQASEAASQHKEPLQLQATMNDTHDISSTGTIPLGLLASCAGTIAIQFKGNFTDLMNTATVHVATHQCVWHNQSIPNIAATITRLSNQPSVHLECPPYGNLDAQVTLAHDGHRAQVTATRDNTMQSTSWNIKTDSSCTNVAATGTLGVYHLSLGASLRPVPHVTHLALHEQENVLLQLQEEQGVLKGTGDIRLLSLLAEQYTGSSTLGEGQYTFEGTISTQQIEGIIALVSGSTIRVPHWYNIVETLRMHFNIQANTRKISLDDVVINLHQGTIRISQAQGSFNNNGIEWAVVPYVAEHCLMSWHKDLFALISGAGTISYSPQKSLVQGFLVIDKGHIRTNILSPRFPTHASSSFSEKNTADKQKTAIELAMNVVTRKPVRVKTPFLETKIGTTMHIEGTIARPLIKGNATLLEGTLLFPYKPLFIRQGTVALHALPEPLSQNLTPVLGYGNVGYEPHINLIAENTIKGYRIRMHVHGPLQNPDLMFSASPHLPLEQIIALLFGGSEDGSIYVAMSTYIMQSIKDLLFGSPDSTSTTLQSLKNLFRPLGSVRFVPSFTDQSSRGGIRGSLAIEVNERLRGIIKQNFDLPQDVMLEVEYDLSDDARVRAIKDERGDLGAEIEASWKF